MLSKYNPLITKEYLQIQAENQYFERKGLGKELIKPSKIAEELIGMLNADGGLLVFGVSDSGEIQDISRLDNLDDYRKLVFDFIAPPCNIKLEEVELDSKLIFLFHVEQELERVFYHKNSQEYFLRVADSNRKLDLDQIKKLEYDKNIRQFEDEIVSDFELEDLDETLLESYCQKLKFKGDRSELLKTRHLITQKNGEYQFKKSAVLLFSKNPEKYIPTASVRYIRYQGIESKTGVEHNVIKDERFENNIPNLIQIIRDFLKISLSDYYFLDLQSGKFVKIPEYPEEAWLEGVVNALCHRSYNRQGSSIYIKHYDDRLEISNSGPLPAQVTVENIKTERFARNPRIARVLEDFGYVRQLNEGVKRIYEIMEKSMLSTPEYQVKNHNVYLLLRNKISTNNKAISTDIMARIENDWQNLNDTQRNVLLFLFVQGGATVKMLSDHTQINENTIRSYLNNFITEGILVRKSEKKRDINALYVFKQD
ncbi:RNA-binding domain-containing protein [Actinobacillus vicugnae]|uniref:RNA-binding domain-containing protein n=1 Tax=Actinobacillus vicugnae TaxID=2573093 RepID=UPI00123FB5E6|nr:ATP-binding protein [Actinobacillus vicugnae]